MKQARARQRHARRNGTPAAIGLAPPKPPIAPPRADASAIPLPASDEPLAITAPSRQLRRQERRAQSKAGRRGKPEAAAVAPIAEAPAPEPIAPLPRSRSLAKPRSRALIILDRLVRPWRRTVPVAPASSAAELHLLRRQLGAAQATLDRLMGAQ